MPNIEPSQLKVLAADPDGLKTYEFLANNIETLDAEDLTTLTENMLAVDRNGQFCASAARYLNAIDPERYKEAVGRLVAAAIERDRDHAYLPDLLPAIWGVDYQDKAAELKLADDNFRRIYKRLFPAAGSI